MRTHRPRIAVMASGRGSNAAALLDAAPDAGADIVLVVSDRADAGVLALASDRGCPTAVVEFLESRDEHEERIIGVLGGAGVEHLLLAGYMRVLSPAFLDAFPGTILNIHPSLLPEFRGLDAARRQWEAGVAVAGATVHLVDAGVDTGPILLQGRIAVRGDEGPDGLAERILTEVEHVIYPRALRMLVQGLDAFADAGDTGMPVRTALISMSVKSGLADLGSRLAKAGVAIVASGGTAAALRQAGLAVTAVEAVTGSPEVLGGRVKTMHPAVHAAILADRRDADHLAQLDRLGHRPIDLVVGNLYPFEAAVRSGSDRAEVVETIDIGGPALLRAAAKNADGGVTVVVDGDDHERVLSWIEAGLPVPLAVRRDLAAKAFRLTASYDAAIAAWASDEAEGLPLGGYRDPVALRYGENPHQRGWRYTDGGSAGVGPGILLQGKPLSYTNLLDLDAAHRASAGMAPHRCAVIKHTNPCGVAEASTQVVAFERALTGDPVAAFGGVLGFNRPLETATVAAIVESGLFVECVAAPGFEAGARDLLVKRPNVRLVDIVAGEPPPRRVLHAIGGGLLVADPDPGPPPIGEWTVATEAQPNDDILGEMWFAMGVVALLTSNAICITSDRTLRGAGAGAVSRVDACRVALDKAGDTAAGAVLASDAFFPFDDSVRLAAAAGIRAVVQPGGSVRDQEVIDACNELGLVMAFTGRRHFRH